MWSKVGRVEILRNDLESGERDLPDGDVGFRVSDLKCDFWVRVNDLQNDFRIGVKDFKMRFQVRVKDLDFDQLELNFKIILKFRIKNTAKLISAHLNFTKNVAKTFLEPGMDCFRRDAILLREKPADVMAGITVGGIPVFSRHAQ